MPLRMNGRYRCNKFLLAIINHDRHKCIIMFMIWSEVERQRFYFNTFNRVCTREDGDGLREIEEGRH